MGELSWTRLCRDCGQALFLDNLESLRNHTGEALTEWRRGVAASVGAVLLDDLEALLP